MEYGLVVWGEQSMSRMRLDLLLANMIEEAELEESEIRWCL